MSLLTLSSQLISGSVGHPPSQHIQVVEYPGPLGYDLGHNSDIPGRAELSAAMEGARKYVSKLHWSCFSWFLSRCRRPCPTAQPSHVIPTSLRFFFWFEGSCEVCQTPCASARGREELPLSCCMVIGLGDRPDSHAPDRCFWKYLFSVHPTKVSLLRALGRNLTMPSRVTFPWTACKCRCPYVCRGLRKPSVRCWGHLESSKSNCL